MKTFYKLRLLGLLALISIFQTVSLSVWGATEPPTGYTKITNISNLSTGDYVILYNSTSGIGVTGVANCPSYESSDEAVVSSEESKWVQYYVTKSNDKITLKDPFLNKYVVENDKKFQYGNSESSFEVTSSGCLKGSSNNLVETTVFSSRDCERSSARWNSSGNAFYVYKVGDTKKKESNSQYSVSPLTMTINADMTNANDDSYYHSQDFTVTLEYAFGGAIYAELEMDDDGYSYVANSNGATNGFIVSKNANSSKMTETFTVYISQYIQNKTYNAYIHVYPQGSGTTEIEYWIPITVIVTNATPDEDDSEATLKLVVSPTGVGTAKFEDDNSTEKTFNDDGYEGNIIATVTNSAYEFWKWTTSDSDAADVSKKGDELKSTAEILACSSATMTANFRRKPTITYNLSDVITGAADNPTQLSYSDNEFTAYFTLAGGYESPTASVTIGGDDYSEYMTFEYDGETGKYKFYVLVEPEENKNIVVNITATKSTKKYTDYVFTCSELELEAPTISNNIMFITTTAGQVVRSHEHFTLSGTGLTPSTKVNFTTGNAALDAVFTFRTKDYKEISTNDSGAITTEGTATSTTVGDLEVYVFYNPTATEDGLDIFDATTQTITASVTGSKPRSTTAGNTVSIVGRHITENFVIAAKMGKGWYALPADMTELENPAPQLIAVDNNDNPTKAYSAKTNLYKIYSQGTTSATATGGTNTDNFKSDGNTVKLAMVNNSNTPLFGSNGNQLGKSGTAVITNPIGKEYWWNLKLHSSVSSMLSGIAQCKYTIQSANNENALKIYGGDRWGSYASGIAELRLLPVDEIEPLEISVAEWGTSEIAVSYAGSATTATLNVAGTQKENVSINNIGGDIKKLSELGDLTAHPMEQLLIQVSEGATIKQKVIQIPFIVSGSKTVNDLRNMTGETTLDNKTDATRNVDIVILKGGTLTTPDVEGNKKDGTFADVYVYPGGKLNITERNLSVYNVYLRGGYSWLKSGRGEGDYLHPQMLVAKGKKLEGIGGLGSRGIFYDLYLGLDVWYLTALPQDVSMSNVTDENGNTAQRSHMLVATYSGEGRTKTPREASWKTVSAADFTDFTFHRGVGYEITADPVISGRPLSIRRFKLQGSWANDDEKDATIDVNAWGKERYDAGTLTANHVGWNLIGNPFYSGYQASGSGIVSWGFVEHKVNDVWTGSYDWDKTGPVKYYTIPNKTDYGYDDSRAANTTLDPFFPFYVQIYDGSSLSFTASSERALKSPATVKAQLSNRELIIDYMIEDDEGKQCTSGLTISDNYSASFDIEDKELSLADVVQLKVYTLCDGYKVAFNSLPEAAISSIPLGYIAPKAGNYSISLKEASDLKYLQSAVLIDHEEGDMEWDLLANGAYEYNSAAATVGNDTRFTLRITLKDESEDVETTVGESAFETLRATSLNGTLLLQGLPEGAQVWVYDMTGKLIAKKGGNSPTLRLSVPQGVYNIRVQSGNEGRTMRAIVK